MSDLDRRFYIIPPDAPSETRDIICVGLPDIAERFAIELGEGAHIVDTLAAPYYPMVKPVENGEAVYLEFGGWDMVAHPETNLIEAVKKGCPPMVRAFLAKGCDANTTDRNGGTALIWATAKGDAEAVRLLIEADAIINTAAATGMTALKMAQKKLHDYIAAMLEATS